MARLRKFWDDAALDVPWSPVPWASIRHVRMFGRPGFFSPRLWPGVAVYDPAPLKRRLKDSIDFERLNRASFSVTTTDIESGEPVVFDTRRGDGGLVANTPVDRAVDWDTGEEEWTVFVLELFARSRARPVSLDEAAARRMDPLFGNQTRQALRLLELELRASGRNKRVRVLHLAYRAPAEEGGAERPFNFSRETLAERWAAGARDMEVAIASLDA